MIYERSLLVAVFCTDVMRFLVNMVQFKGCYMKYESECISLKPFLSCFMYCKGTKNKTICCIPPFKWTFDYLPGFMSAVASCFGIPVKSVLDNLWGNWICSTTLHRSIKCIDFYMISIKAKACLNSLSCLSSVVMTPLRNQRAFQGQTNYF